MTYKQKIKDLKIIMEHCDFRFSNYQDIPPFVLKRIPELKEIKYKKRQIDLDLQRYEWLKKKLPKDISKVCEVGANMGYFSISLANEFKVLVHAFESNNSYTRICNILSDLVNLSKRLEFLNKSVSLESINSLENYDLIINLNVLHHAGVFFDNNLVKNNKEWIKYSITYLKNLRKKTKYLFFQTGNMSNNNAIFPSESTISFLKKIFDESGWIIKNVGVIKNLKKLKYESYNLDEIDSIELFKCKRDKEMNKVAYYSNKKLVSYMQTGLAQRPLWFCQNK